MHSFLFIGSRMRTNEKVVRQGAAGRREYAGQQQLIGDAGHERV